MTETSGAVKLTGPLLVFGGPYSNLEATKAVLDEARRLWMGSLLPQLHLDINGRRLVAVHGGVTSINRFIFATSKEAIEEELAASGCDGVIAGHCGLPFTCESGGRLWHNAGVVGMPANDGTPRVWFSVLVPSDGDIHIEHHALDYNHIAAAARMRQYDLPEGYAAALETGLWPSCDVLPSTEYPARG